MLPVCDFLSGLEGIVTVVLLVLVGPAGCAPKMAANKTSRQNDVIPPQPLISPLDEVNPNPHSLHCTPQGGVKKGVSRGVCRKGCACVCSSGVGVSKMGCRGLGETCFQPALIFSLNGVPFGLSPLG